ncbi:hypothetical protein M9Y10_012229 [Tritrichomonas musculus]|uniref:non-specific serine/threonine protein kinase n=1 Tax=Tritrichomonas musculus TaxID=1915356 RepID=A0ABR2IBZ9_9EUKA
MTQNSKKSHILPNKTKIDHYIIDSHIGHDSNGEIYTVYDERHEGPWAMKVEMKNNKKHSLTEEIQCLQILRGSPMFPEYICNGETNELKYFIMELLGPPILLIRRSLPDLRFTQLTVTIMAKEMLKCIEELHKRGYIHRNIKPGHFLIRPNRQNPVVLIDFSSSRRYTDIKTGNLLPPRPNPGFSGSCSFSSMYAHEGKELGRRDDIFSWIFTVIQMVDKRLPWPGHKDPEKTYKIKQQIRPYDLCRSLPRVFTTIYIKTLGYLFEDEPDYQNFYKLLDKVIQDLGGYEKPFDWELLSPDVISHISSIPLDMDSSKSPRKNSKDKEKTLSKEKITDNEVFECSRTGKNDNNYFIDENEESMFHTIIGQIGEGSASFTYKVIDKQTKTPMCKKVLKYKEGQTTIKDAKRAIQEFEILYKISHPCICEALRINTSETLEVVNKKGEKQNITTIAIFLEYLEYGLNEVLKKEINNTLKVRIILDIVHAMNYLHKHGMIHRDLKIENIMLNEFFETKLVDFGLIKITESTSF